MNDYTDRHVTIHQGGVFDVLPNMKAESVHCVVTSPPYWALRNYGVEGQLGLEATPEEYVANMVQVFSEVRRVMRHDATLWLNMGDSYIGNTPGSRHPDRWPKQARNDHVSDACRSGSGLRPKNLVGMPWRLALALQADGWYLRSEIIWEKPNAMPDSVKDRPSKSHETIFLLTKSPKYFYDADAIREPVVGKRFSGKAGVSRDDYDEVKWKDRTDGSAGCRPPMTMKNREYNPLGRNKRTVWTVPTHPCKEAHFATFPPKLIEPCILAGTSNEGCCPECGAPWRQPTIDGGCDPEWIPTCTTDCANYYEDEYDEDMRRPVPCTVFDPFLGIGTTALVAKDNGRRCIGVELSPEYIEIAKDRIGQGVLF